MDETAADPESGARGYPFVLVWIHPATMVRSDADASEVLLAHWEQSVEHARGAEREGMGPYTYAAVLMAVPVEHAEGVVRAITELMQDA